MINLVPDACHTGSDMRAGAAVDLLDLLAVCGIRVRCYSWSSRFGLAAFGGRWGVAQDDLLTLSTARLERRTTNNNVNNHCDNSFNGFTCRSI